MPKNAILNGKHTQANRRSFYPNNQGQAAYARALNPTLSSLR